MACEICPITDLYEKMYERSEAARMHYSEQKRKLGQLTFQRLDVPSKLEGDKSVADYIEDVDRATRVVDALRGAMAYAETIDCATKDTVRLHMCPRLLYLNYEVDQARRIDPGLDDVLSGTIDPYES